MRRLRLGELPISRRRAYWQGGAVPSWQTTVVVDPGGTTTVVLAGGFGLPLLMQPHSITETIANADRIFIISPVFSRHASSLRNTRPARQECRAHEFMG